MRLSKRRMLKGIGVTTRFSQSNPLVPMRLESQLSKIREGTNVLTKILEYIIIREVSR